MYNNSDSTVLSKFETYSCNMAQGSDYIEGVKTPPVIDWFCRSMAASSSSDSETDYPFQTVTSAISKLEMLQNENITYDLIEISDQPYRLNEDRYSGMNLVKKSNEIETSPEQILNHQIHRDLETEFQDCERLYNLRNIFPFA